MALVNPNIAMSFRQPEFRPRNALAEYAQVQQIMGGQRQAEMADMQMESFRRKEKAISQIQAAAAKNGGPTDRREIARAYINSGVPEFMQFGLTMDKDLDELDAFSRIMGGGAGGGARAAPAAAATLANAMSAPAAAAPTMPALAAAEFTAPTKNEFAGTQSPEQRQRQIEGVQDTYRSQLQMADEISATNPAQAEFLRGQAQRTLDALTRDYGITLAQPPAAANTLAPAAAPVTNAMVAPAAQPAVPPAGLNQLASAGAAPAGAAFAGAAPPNSVAALRARRDQLIALGTPRALQAAKSLDADIALMSKTTAVPRDSVVIGPDGKVIYTAPAAATAPRIDLIGVAKGTETPVYFDKDAKTQFTIGTDPSGKQIQVPYTGAVNRSTSNVTATATSMGGKLEGAEQKGQGELNIKSFAEIRDAARLAARTLPALETQAKILDQGFTTGFGTEVKKAGASFLAALGVPEAEKFATDAQTFLSATQQAVLQKQLEQKGTQTKADADRIEKTGAQFGNTVKGNRFIIDVAREQLRRDIEQRDFYSNWWNNKKTYEGAEDAWYASEGGKSLFDRPALKKYAAPAQGAAAVGAAPAIPQAAINDLKAGRGTDAQFDAIFGAGAAKRVREGK